MAYSSGILRERVTILNRDEQTVGRFGIDSAGVEWSEAGTVWASVDWAKGKGAMNAGALDVYGVVIVSSGSKEPRSALESRRVSLGADWVDSRESSLLRRLERGREIGR